MRTSQTLNSGTAEELSVCPAISMIQMNEFIVY